MTSILIVVTFLAGATWGPAVTMTPTSSADACAALSLEVTRQIAIVAKTNILGGATIIKDGEELTVVAGPQGTREIARVRCA